MSVQENNLKAIADAIRAVDGSKNPIPASQFKDRIVLLGDRMNVPLTVYVDAGATVKVEQGDTVLTAISGEDGSAKLFLPQAGDWIITPELDGKMLTPKTIAVPTGYEESFSFTASRLPEGYTEVEYIAGAGNVVPSYIPYLTIPTTTGAVELKFAFSCSNQNEMNQSSAMYLLGKNRSTGTAATARAWYAFGAGGKKIKYIYGSSTQSVESIEAVQDVKYDVDIHVTNKVLEVNGTATPLLTTSSWISKEFDIFRASNVNNSYHSISSYIMKYVTLYYLQLLDENGNLLRNLVPCLNNSGEAGMYDIVTDIFFSNKNTIADSRNKFTPGPAV